MFRPCCRDSLPQTPHMAVKLSDEHRKHALASIKRYADEQLDLQLGEIAATSLLDFFLGEIAPSVYNGAIAEAQTFMRDRVADLETTCYEHEFGYWAKSASVRRK